MDVKEFISEYKRMCSYYYDTQCEKNGEYCPMKNRICDSIECLTETAIDDVESWSKTHPIETRQSAMLKIFPKARMFEDEDFLSICPNTADSSFECPTSKKVSCSDCRKKYWSEAVE